MKKIKNGQLKTIITLYNKVLNVAISDIDKAEIIADDYLKIEDAMKKFNKLIEAFQNKIKEIAVDKLSTEEKEKLEADLNQEHIKLLEKEVTVDLVGFDKKDLKGVQVTPLELMVVKKLEILK
jgi:hypothetical protein